MTKQNKKSLRDRITEINKRIYALKLIVWGCLHPNAIDLIQAQESVIKDLEAIIEMQQQAFDDIIRLQSDVADSVAQNALKKSDKLMNGGEDE